MEDIKINEDIKNIIENTSIPVNIIFKYEQGKDNKFKLKESESKTKKLLKEIIIYKSTKKMIYHLPYELYFLIFPTI